MLRIKCPQNRVNSRVKCPAFFDADVNNKKHRAGGYCIITDKNGQNSEEFEVRN